MEFFKNNQKPITFILALFLIGTGFFLRLSIYQADHELWLDEANTANKACQLNLAKISQLDGSSYDAMHAYPIGFMAVLKTLVLRLGPFESVLRLFPILCSLAGVLIFWMLCRQLFEGPFVLLPLFLFCVNLSILEHSSELKPYASDILSVIILLHIFLKHSSTTHRLKDAIYFAALGFILIYFSFPAIFVLFSTGGLIFINDLCRKNWKSSLRWGGLISVWALGFGLYYFFSLRFFMNDTRLFESWGKNFFPWSSNIPVNMSWIKDAIVIIAHHLAGRSLITFTLTVIGIFLIAQKKLEKTLIFLAPFLSVFLLAALKLYPLHERTVTFLVPYLIILVSTGLEPFISKFKNRSWVIGLCGSGLLVYVLTASMIPLMRFQNIGSHPEDMRKLLAHLDKKFSASADLLIVNDSGKYAFEYYSRFLSQTFPAENIFISCDLLEVENGAKGLYLMHASSKNFVLMTFSAPQNFTRLNTNDKKRRVWVLLSHYHDEIRMFLMDFLGHEGYVLQEISEQEGSRLLLFVPRT